MQDSAVLSCSCGQVRLDIAGSPPAGGVRLSCYCKDCRAFPTHLGATQILDDWGGVDLYQCPPDRLAIRAGAELLSALRLSPKGPLRWYATCCGTPLALTPATTALPFVSLSVAAIHGADLGPRTAVVFSEQALAGPEPAPSNFGLSGVVLKLLRRVLAAYLTGKRKVTPFFDQTGNPISVPTVLSRDERTKATTLP
ncbi:MAG: DUF6151 family protein [Pseudomonadota bacterium]